MKACIACSVTMQARQDARLFLMKNIGAFFPLYPQIWLSLLQVENDVDTPYCRNKLNDLNKEKKKPGIFRSVVIQWLSLFETLC